ncbi:MAG: hypothetical protein RMI49_03965 [Candidatus Caldarchaeum sp.]|nr:hypothetical protein [Candidatus Caldarchaeum sp.]
MIDKALRVVALLPPVLITLTAITRTQLSNPFVLIGMLSLILISSTDSFKWGGIAFVYVPAIYTVYLLLTGVISPFLGLAAGYILSTPFVLAISAYRTNSITGLITGYYASYLFSLLLYGVVVGGNVQPERLFLALIRNLLGIASLERINLTPATPEPSLVYNSIAALATLSLLVYLAFLEKSRKPKFTPAFLKSLATVIAVSGFVVVASELFPALSSYVLLGSLAVLLSILALTMRGGS